MLSEAWSVFELELELAEPGVGVDVGAVREAPGTVVIGFLT